MTLMHSWPIFWRGLDGTEELTVSEIEKAFINDSVCWHDQNSLFTLLHGRLN